MRHPDSYGFFCENNQCRIPAFSKPTRFVKCPLGISGHTGGNPTLFFERLQGGDKTLEAVWVQYLSYLAWTINNLITAFDCTVILGGYLGEYQFTQADFNCNLPNRSHTDKFLIP
jgi:predicted NBD/HSP70 family sugar kinase